MDAFSSALNAQQVTHLPRMGSFTSPGSWHRYQVDQGPVAFCVSQWRTKRKTTTTEMEGLCNKKLVEMKQSGDGRKTQKIEDY